MPTETPLALSLRRLASAINEANEKVENSKAAIELLRGSTCHCYITVVPLAGNNAYCSDGIPHYEALARFEMDLANAESLLVKLNKIGEKSINPPTPQNDELAQDNRETETRSRL